MINYANFSETLNGLCLFSIKSLIISFIAYAFLQSYLPSGQLLLIPEYYQEINAFLNRSHIKKQMIGSLSSPFAVEDKIRQLEKTSDAEMITFAKEHKKSLLFQQHNK